MIALVATATGAFSCPRQTCLSVEAGKGPDKGSEIEALHPFHGDYLIMK
jgi:hypothetical protein